MLPSLCLLVLILAPVLFHYETGVCSAPKWHQNSSHLNIFCTKIIFSLVLVFDPNPSFIPNLGYENQRRLFSGILPGMFAQSKDLGCYWLLADYYCAPIFYNSNNLNCFEALSFLRSVHTFLWFFIGIVILVTPKQEMDRKSERYYGLKSFRSTFK